MQISHLCKMQDSQFRHNYTASDLLCCDDEINEQGILIASAITLPDYSIEQCIMLNVDVCKGRWQVACGQGG